MAEISSEEAIGRTGVFAYSVSGVVDGLDLLEGHRQARNGLTWY